MQRQSILVLFGLILFFLTGCTKDSTNTINNTSIIGTWELKQEQGGMMPAIDYPQGSGNLLKISGSEYQKYNNNNLVKSGHFTIVEDATVEKEVGLVIPAGQFNHRIVFDNNLSAPKIFIQISNNKLTMLSGYFPLDGGSSVVYQKLDGQ